MKLEGFFSTYKDANKAVEQLKKEGIKAYADINDHYRAHYNIQTNQPGNETAPSLSDLVLRSGDPSGMTDKSPLAAADPMVSGMGGFEEIADINCKVVADVDSKDESKAKEIIASAGGDFNSPNLNLPDRIKDMTIKNIDMNDLPL